MVLSRITNIIKWSYRETFSLLDEMNGEKRLDLFRQNSTEMMYVQTLMALGRQYERDNPVLNNK